MKLFYSHASPFARKCRIVAKLRNINDLQEIEAMPLSNPPELVAANPIVQVPTLIFNDGKAIFNSPLICAYLHQMGEGANLYGDNELETRRIESIGDALCEMAVKIAMENRRPENERSPMFIERWQSNILRTFEVANKESLSLLNAPINIGSISIVCTLTYIAFRFPYLEWQKYENLAALHEKLEKLPEFIATIPK